MSVSLDATIGLILARAGSKRVPNKNTRLMNGRPLIAYTLEAAISSRCFATIVVSTDDARVAEIARESGVSVDRRPTELCGDTVRAVEVVEEFLIRNDAKDQFSNIAMLLPTCPFRTLEDIRGAMLRFQDSNHSEPLVTVTQYDFPPQFALEPVDQHLGRMRMCESAAYATSTRSQSIPPRYHPNGGLYVASIDKFLSRGSFFTERMLTYAMPAERSLDIDYPWQFQLAELWAQQVHCLNEGSGTIS